MGAEMERLMQDGYCPKLIKEFRREIETRAAREKRNERLQQALKRTLVRQKLKEEQQKDSWCNKIIQLVQNRSGSKKRKKLTQWQRTLNNAA